MKTIGGADKLSAKDVNSEKMDENDIKKQGKERLRDPLQKSQSVKITMSHNSNWDNLGKIQATLFLRRAMETFLPLLYKVSVNKEFSVVLKQC